MFYCGLGGFPQQQPSNTQNTKKNIIIIKCSEMNDILCIFKNKIQTPNTVFSVLNIIIFYCLNMAIRMCILLVGSGDFKNVLRKNQIKRGTCGTQST